MPSVTCAMGDIIWLVHRTDPSFDLQPLFQDLLGYIAAKPAYRGLVFVGFGKSWLRVPHGGGGDRTD